MSNIIENFHSIVSALHDEAPSDKARAFTLKLADRIRERGDEWLIANAVKLGITQSAQKLEALAPVEDNRMYYLAQWQLALAS